MSELDLNSMIASAIDNSFLDKEDFYQYKDEHKQESSIMYFDLKERISKLQLDVDIIFKEFNNNLSQLRIKFKRWIITSSSILVLLIASIIYLIIR